MTRVISYPSELFPPLPNVSIVLPNDWEPLFVPDTLIAGAEILVPGRFRTNVCVSVTRSVGTRTIAEAASSVAQGLESSPEYAEVGREIRTVAGLEGFRIEGSFFAEGLGTLYQAVHVAVVHQGNTSDTITAVGTITASEAEATLPVVRTALESLRCG